MVKFQIPNHKFQTNYNYRNLKLRSFAHWIFGHWCLFVIWCLVLGILASRLPCAFAQEGDLELTVDINAATSPLPKIFKPNIDLGGRGFYRLQNWPQTQAAKEVLDNWQNNIGFGNLYRLQYSLWEISQLAKDKEAQDQLLANYESIIKAISDSGGTVIVNIFGTPAGMGKALDPKTPAQNLKAFKELIKNTIRNLSCNKRYNIWYEIWNAPDLDDFFLGRRQEYLNLYKEVGESINELKQESKIYILLGGPSTSAWFQGVDGNTIATPEKSLIYELIKFCHSNHLPLDFISWHGYTTDPYAEREETIYNKTAITLIREWLTYFKFDKNTPLIVDEWNFDRNANLLPERQERSFVAASYIPARIKNMNRQGINYQVYFSLEDFQNNKEGVVRNTGIFFFDSEYTTYKGGPKAIYNVFKMLNRLGNNMFQLKIDDEFIGAIATKDEDSIEIIIYNYIDPEIPTNYLSRNIATLNASGRKMLINVIKSDKLEQIMSGKIDASSLRASAKVKNMLMKARKLNEQANKYIDLSRSLKINFKNLKDNYTMQIYSIDSSCSSNCEFEPIQKKEINASEQYQEVLSLKPYSVTMLMLNKKQKEEPVVPATQQEGNQSKEKDAGAN